MSLLSNAKWNAFSQFFKIAVQVLNLVYLAKIIPPSEYGVMAMAAVIVNFGVLVRDLGTSAAIIQRKIVDENLKNTVFWLNVILGLIITITICLLSKPLAILYNQPKLFNVFLMISIIFPLSSCASAHLALLERDNKFKVISRIEIISSTLSVVVAIVLAKMGFGVYSLVMQAIVLNLVSAIQFWSVSSWKPNHKVFIKKESLKEIFGFSVNLSLFNIINYFSRNGDSFIIGKFMSVVVLGNYNLAYRIMLFPLQSLTFVVSRSLYPVLSKHQDENDIIFKNYCSCVFVIVFITAPLMSGIALLSIPIVNIIFGHQWYLASEILKVLAPTAIIQSILSTTGSVFTAKGKTKTLMKLGILGTFLQFGSFIIGVNFDIVTFAFCYLVANVLNFFPVMIVLMNVISGSLGAFIKSLIPVFVSTGIMVFSIFMVDNFFMKLDSISNMKGVIFIGVFGLFIYLLSVLFVSRKIRIITICKVKKLFG